MTGYPPGLALDGLDQVAEDELVERVQEVPVEDARKPDRLEEGGLDETGAAILGPRLPLQSGPPRDFHLGAQPQEVRRLDRLDAPEVESLTRPELQRMAPR